MLTLRLMADAGALTLGLAAAPMSLHSQGTPGQLAEFGANSSI